MYIEYEEEDYNYDDGFEYGSNNYNRRRPTKNVKVKKHRVPTKNQKTKHIIIIILLTIIGVVSLLSINAYLNSYGYFEKVMVKTAEEYIKKNNMTIRDKIYLDVKKIGMEPKEGCTLLSGVIVDKEGNYTPYLECTEYTSPIVVNDDTEVKLNGHAVTAIPKGIPYYEMGVAYGQYTIVGKVGTEEGVYDLVYNVILNGTSHTLKRVVIVTDNSYVRTLYPSISLNGNSVERTIRGYDYYDKGAMAIDNVDGNITKSIRGSHNINPNASGEYEYIYIVTNSRGYTNTIKRKVVVVENYTTTVLTATVFPETMTNQNVTIKINAFGNDYKSITLPDYRTVSDNEIEFTVTKNGDYAFLALDKDGKNVSKIVHIDNIDKVAPTGSCFAKVYPKYVDITVNPTTNKQISGYNYIVDGKESGYINSTTYRVIKNNARSASIQIKDSIGNVSTSTCTVKYMDPTIGNNKVKYYTYKGVEYVIPNTKNDLTTFEKATCHKISQDANVAECGSSCLSFSLYHSAIIQYGSIGEMNENQACHYGYTHLAHIRTLSNPTKKDALKVVYDTILAGGSPVLQVTGTKTRSSRHFFLVVGYRRSKYNASDLVEEDLLCIDSWSGCFSSLSFADTSKRTMFDNKDGKGYRVDLMIRN
ncbi:MAG: DUF5011 domain-containing protein [Bacilli bacterium]|nr:DUF5011 domain-containing protein [Bacilli bacterium]